MCTYTPVKGYEGQLMLTEDSVINCVTGEVTKVTDYDQTIVVKSMSGASYEVPVVQLICSTFLPPCYNKLVKEYFTETPTTPTTPTTTPTAEPAPKRKRKPFPKEIAEEAYLRTLEGESIAKLAEEYGVCYSTLHNHIACIRANDTPKLY